MVVKGVFNPISNHLDKRHDSRTNETAYEEIWNPHGTSCRELPSRRTAQTIGQQLLRCGTSVGANYRAACRARSDAEFRSKLGICEEEADEAVYWLELIAELGYIKAALLGELIKETNEILAIIVASIKTSRRRR
jgi:four helix bundle protein